MNRTPAHLLPLTRPRLSRMMTARFGRAFAHHPEGLPFWVEVFNGSEATGGRWFVKRVWVSCEEVARRVITLGGQVPQPVGAIAKRTGDA